MLSSVDSVETWGRIIDDPIYVVQEKIFGNQYLETAEERGLSEGPMLLRVFQTREEAERYRQALIEYQGPGLMVEQTNLDSLWLQYANWSNTKIELCQMSESEWARPILTLRAPEAVAC